MTGNVFGPPPSSTSSSSISHYTWNNLTSAKIKERNTREVFGSETMPAQWALKSNGTINKRTDVMTKWALSHPLCATNVTSYVGQTATMHCCLARLDRDLSVTFLYSYFWHAIFYCQLILEIKRNFYCQWLNGINQRAMR